ncbi:MAG: ABC transporter substrate-binding protein [Muribaculaceae bacterium]|nr:ABC transporter substrate-binding protein [Muribaculaceae bacterium]
MMSDNYIKPSLRQLPVYVLYLLLGLCFSACGGGADSTVDENAVIADTLTHHARLLTIAVRPDSVVLVDIRDPWQPERIAWRYALIDSGMAMPDSLPPGVVAVRTPIDRMAVFSSVHTSAIAELGAIDAMRAVAEAHYFATDDTVQALVAAGKVTDVGKATQPSTERLVASGARAVLNSPMQGTTLNLPVGMTQIPMADYMETTPIGRAEWILLLGELTGRRDEARAIFDSVIDNYSELVFKASGAESPKPKVLTDTEYSGVWYVPAGDSYMARMIADAGGILPWDDMPGSGSLALGLETVAERALDADVWLVRSFGYDTTPESLAAVNPRYKTFKAWREGNIYSCNSAERNIFDATAFHPDEVLAEYVAIFHPDVMPGYELKYFRRTGGK